MVEQSIYKEYLNHTLGLTLSTPGLARFYFPRAILHSTISFVTWSKKYEWAVTGLGTIRLGLALFQRISGPLAELQIIKSTIERNLWGYFKDTKQTWAHGVFPRRGITAPSTPRPQIRPCFPRIQFSIATSKMMSLRLFYWLGTFSHIILFLGPAGKKRS